MRCWQFLDKKARRLSGPGTIKGRNIKFPGFQTTLQCMFGASYYIIIVVKTDICVSGPCTEHRRSTLCMSVLLQLILH